MLIWLGYGKAESLYLFFWAQTLSANSRNFVLFSNTFKFPFRIELKIVEAHVSLTMIARQRIFSIETSVGLLWFFSNVPDISFFLAKSLTSCFSKCPWTRKASEVTSVKQRQEKFALRLGIEAVFTCQHSPKSAWHNAVWGQLLPWHLETQLPPQRMDLKVCKSCCMCHHFCWFLPVLNSFRNTASAPPSISGKHHFLNASTSKFWSLACVTISVGSLLLQKVKDDM